MMYTVQMAIDNKAAGIRAAALRILERRGPKAVSMRGVARAAGVTAMAIYHYFPSRNALLHEITSAEFRKFTAALEARAGVSPPGKRLAALLDCYLDFVFARPRVFDYAFSNPRPGARRYPKDFRERKSPTFNLLLDTVAAGIREGTFRKGDAAEIALTIAAHTQGLITLWRGGRFDLTPDEFRALAKRSAKRILDGLHEPPHR